MPRPKAPKAPSLPVGAVVVPRPETRLRGADSFTRLVVIDVDKRGLLRLALLDDGTGGPWDNVPPDAVIRVAV